MSTTSIRFRPLQGFAESRSGLLECFSCGAHVPRLARYLDDRGVVVLLCEGCEEDVLDEIEQEDDAD